MGAGALAAFGSRLEMTSGTTLDQLDVSNAVGVAIGFDPKTSFRVAGGNQSLASSMARELGHAVHLNDPVEGIRHGQSHQTVLLRSGSVECDAVVIAVPLAVLSRLALTPALPDWKLNAIARSGVGHVAKLHVPLSGAERPPWSAVQSVRDRFWTWTATDFSGGVQRVLHCFSGSRPALERLAVESVLGLGRARPRAT